MLARSAEDSECVRALAARRGLGVVNKKPANITEIPATRLSEKASISPSALLSNPPALKINVPRAISAFAIASRRVVRRLANRSAGQFQYESI